MPPLAYCMGFGPMLEASYTLNATHPSGATGQFEFSNHRHSRSGVSINECVQTGDASNPTYELKVPHYFDVLGLDRKVIAGPGIAAPMTWDYAYTTSLEPLWGTWGTQTTYPCTTCNQEKATTVTAPDGTATRHWFGMQYYFNDGRLLRVETLDEAGAVLRTQTTTYMTDAQAAGQPFHGVYGSVPYYVSDPVKQQVRPVVERSTLQQGVTFKWHANAFDSYAMPVDVTRSSTLSGSPLVRETIQYYHHEPKWILGQVARLVGSTSPTASC